MTIGALVIRPAEERDLPEVLGIERESFADPWSAESFRDSLSLDRIRFLVAEESPGLKKGWGERKTGHATLLGYVIALLVADEAEIADLAVAPAARRRGIGAILLDRVAGEVAEHGVRSLYLEVRESNVAARALYRSRSFVQVGLRKGYYRHPTEDALILKRDLAPA